MFFYPYLDGVLICSLPNSKQPGTCKKRSHACRRWVHHQWRIAASSLPINWSIWVSCWAPTSAPSPCPRTYSARCGPSRPCTLQEASGPNDHGLPMRDDDLLPGHHPVVKSYPRALPELLLPFREKTETFIHLALTLPPIYEEGWWKSSHRLTRLTLWEQVLDRPACWAGELTYRGLCSGDTVCQGETLEFGATRLVLLPFLPWLLHHQVLVKTDNITAKVYVSKHVKQIHFKWAESHLTTIWAEHLAGTDDSTTN